MTPTYVLTVWLALLGTYAAQTLNGEKDSTGVAVSVVPLNRVDGALDVSNSLTISPSHGPRRIDNEIHPIGLHQDIMTSSPLLLASPSGITLDNEVMPTISVNRNDQKTRTVKKSKRQRSRKDRKNKKMVTKRPVNTRSSMLKKKILKRRRLQKARRQAFIKAVRKAINNIIKHVNTVHKACLGTENCDEQLRQKLFRLATLKPKAMAALANEKQKVKGKKRQPRLLKKPTIKPVMLTSPIPKLSSKATPERASTMTSKPTSLSTSKPTSLSTSKITSGPMTETSLNPMTTRITTAGRQKTVKKGSKASKRKQMLSRMKKRLMKQKMKKRRRGKKPAKVRDTMPEIKIPPRTVTSRGTRPPLQTSA